MVRQAKFYKCAVKQQRLRLAICNRGSGPPFRRVRHSESRHSWSLQGIVLDIATTRRLTLTLILTVSLTVSCHCWKWLKMADPSEWRPLGMAGRHRNRMINNIKTVYGNTSKAIHGDVFYY